ncbi:MAG: hypothetical protein EOO82_03340 [Oxalobacteraceae bacterium]|nr:MAG: hypothetical protein EOO82_03340 [Oxalobacteraceae bacterium]
MTTVDVAVSSLDSATSEPRMWSFRRVFAAFAIFLALTSAVLTFVVLTGLTEIVPTHEVVLTFLLINGVLIARHQR